MTIICIKETNIIYMMGEIVSENDKELTISTNGVNACLLKNINNIYNVENVPSEITPCRYCYTETEGFYPNPDYKEPNPYGIPDETYETIIDDYTTQLIEEGVIG